jgi:hypothetical protein
MNNFLDRCLNEVHEEPSIEWGESSGLPINSMQNLARTSETHAPTDERRIVFVMTRSDRAGDSASENSQSVSRMSVPVAVDLLEQWISEVVEAQSDETDAPKQPNALKVVQRRSHRTKLKETQSETCTICLENFRRAQLVRRLPCGHVLHDWCCRKYFKTAGVKPLCPVCRFDMSCAS